MKIFKIVPAILLLILACNIIICQSNECPANIDSDDCNDICQKHENICTLHSSDGSTHQIGPTEIFETNVNGHKNVACRCCCAKYKTDCYTSDPKSRKGVVTYSFSCLSSTEGGGGGGGYQPSSGGGDDPSDQSKSCENSDTCVSCTCNGVKLPDTGANDCSSKASTCAALHPIKCGKGGSINQSCQAGVLSIGTVIFFVVLLGVIVAGLFFLGKRFMPRTEGIFSGDDSNYRAL